MRVVVIALVVGLAVGFGAGYGISAATHDQDVTVINKSGAPKPPLDILK